MTAFGREKPFHGLRIHSGWRRNQRRSTGSAGIIRDSDKSIDDAAVSDRRPARRCLRIGAYLTAACSGVSRYQRPSDIDYSSKRNSGRSFTRSQSSTIHHESLSCKLHPQQNPRLHLTSYQDGRDSLFVEHRRKDSGIR